MACERGGVEPANDLRERGRNRTEERTHDGRFDRCLDLSILELNLSSEFVASTLPRFPQILTLLAFN